MFIGLGQDDSSADGAAPPSSQIVPWKVALGVGGVAVIAGGAGFVLGHWLAKRSCSAAAETQTAVVPAKVANRPGRRKIK